MEPPQAAPADAAPDDLRIGSWARAGDLTGVVAATADGTVTLYDPGLRQMARVPREEASPVAAGAVTVTVEVDLPVPHGLAEEALVRWVASIADEGVRERARAALAEAGLDAAVTLPDARLRIQAASTSGALCLCGARTPAPDGSAVACDQCGREAVAPPARRDGGDVLGLR